MKKRNLLILAAAAVIIAAIGARRETVGSGEIGLRTSVIGGSKVFHPGEKVLVFPGIARLVRFSNRPMSVLFTDEDAITVKSGGVPRRVEAAVRYRLADPALLVKRFGPEPPEKKIAAEIKRILSRELETAAATADGFMATVQDRVLMTARLLETLSNDLAPMGLAPLNLDLRLREDEKKPA